MWWHCFPHYKSMGLFSYAQGQLTPWSVLISCQISNSSKLSCMSSLPASMKRVRSKAFEKTWWRRFSNYNSMGAICCHGNQNSDPFWSKTYWSLSPTPLILQIKFHSNQPTGCRDIHVWKCERMDARTHRHRLDQSTISSPMSLWLRWAKKIFWYFIHLVITYHKSEYLFVFCLWSMLTCLLNLQILAQNDIYSILAYFGSHCL